MTFQTQNITNLVVWNRLQLLQLLSDANPQRVEHLSHLGKSLGFETFMFVNSQQYNFARDCVTGCNVFEQRIIILGILSEMMFRIIAATWWHIQSL